jgi:outer membrane protein assembly factor BamB
MEQVTSGGSQEAESASSIPVSRREMLLASAAGMSGLAGCFGTGIQDTDDECGTEGLPKSDLGVVSGDRPVSVPADASWSHSQWKDPNSTRSLSNASTPTDGVRRAWKKAVPSADYDIEHEPVIAGETVYLRTAEEEILALNIADGTERWRSDSYDDPIQPVATDDRVFVADESAVRTLGPSSGEELDTLASVEEYPGTSNQASPMLVDGTLLFRPDERLVALDLESGERRWEYSEPADDFKTIVGAATSETVYVGSLGDSELRGISLDDGTRQWSMSGTWKVSIRGDRLFETGQPDASKGGRARAFNLNGDEPTEVWTFEGELEKMQRPAVGDGYVALSSIGDRGGKSNGSNVYVLDAASGSLEWCQYLGGMSPPYPPVIAGGAVYLAQDNRVHAFDLETGDPLWRYVTEERDSSYAALSVVDGAVVYETDDHVVALSSPET